MSRNLWVYKKGVMNSGMVVVDLSAENSDRVGIEAISANGRPRRNRTFSKLGSTRQSFMDKDYYCISYTLYSKPQK